MDPAARCLVIENLTVSYNRIPAVHHLNLSLPAATSVGLLGPNGAGKTTLLKAIGGLLAIETGKVTFGDAASAHAVAYVPQREAVDWDFPITVQALVEMGRYSTLGLWNSYSDEDARVVKSALEITELESLAHRQIKALSGGQQQRAFLARALAQKASVYLLDEPFTGLDANAQAAFADALRRLRDLGKLVIASHHNLASVPDLFDEVILINGELVASGPTATTFTRENIRKTFSTSIFSGHTS
ncbi:MAG: metal ABC transporter ATP-binding protein [Terrimicrobiaceae bacterium]